MRQSAIEAFFSPELSNSVRTSRQRRVAADRERSGIMPRPLPASRDSPRFRVKPVAGSLNSNIVPLSESATPAGEEFAIPGWLCSKRRLRDAGDRRCFGSVPPGLSVKV